VRRPKGERP